MAKRDELLFLEDILECIDRINDYTQDISEFEFEWDVEKQDAVTRRIEIIGEMVKNISFETKAKYPQVPWHKIAGTRDIVIRKGHQKAETTNQLVLTDTKGEIIGFGLPESK